ncbi:unnamed protein product, partial [Heterosigma akashiwo]
STRKKEKKRGASKSTALLHSFQKHLHQATEEMADTGSSGDNKRKRDEEEDVGKEAKDGDWKCDDCGHTNFAFRVEYQKCNKSGGMEARGLRPRMAIGCAANAATTTSPSAMCATGAAAAPRAAAGATRRTGPAASAGTPTTPSASAVTGGPAARPAPPGPAP